MTGLPQRLARLEAIESQLSAPTGAEVFAANQRQTLRARRELALALGQPDCGPVDGDALADTALLARWRRQLGYENDGDADARAELLARLSRIAAGMAGVETA